MPQDPSAYTKVPWPVLEAAHRELDAHGWSVFAFLGACLNALTHRPAEVMALVGNYRISGRRGRPRKPQPAPKP